MIGAGDSPSRTLATREAADALQVSLAALPEDRRIAIQLRDPDGRSIEEITGNHAAQCAAVRSLLFHVRGQLRDLLGSASRFLSAGGGNPHIAENRLSARAGRLDAARGGGLRLHGATTVMKQPQTAPSEKLERVEAVVSELIGGGGCGTLDAAALIAANPELMPELGERLATLHEILNASAAAKAGAGGRLRHRCCDR